jgi:hypothetical protein
MASLKNIYREGWGMDKSSYRYGPMEGFCERDNENFDFTTAGEILAEKITPIFQVTSGE